MMITVTMMKKRKTKNWMIMSTAITTTTIMMSIHYTHIIDALTHVISRTRTHR